MKHLQLFRTLLSNKAAAGLLLLSAASLGQPALAAPVLSLSPTVSPPTTNVNVAAGGFAAGALVDIYFDTTDLCLTVASATGNASCVIKVPKDAQPQFHWITAAQRNTGTGVQKPFLVRTDWPQFHGRNAAHSGVNPYENTLSPSNVADLDILWHASIGTSGTASAPVVWGGNVYLPTIDGFLYAFSTRTGTPVPGFPKTLGGEVRDGSPAVGWGNVYVATGAGDNKLYAFNALNGQSIAGFPIPLGGPTYASPTLYGGNIYVSCGDGNVYAFNGRTGTAVPGFPVNISAAGQNGGAVSAADGRIFVGSLSGTLRTFDAQTGAAVSGYPTGYPVNTSAIYGTPVLTSGRAFYSSLNAVNGLRVDFGSPLAGFPIPVAGTLRSSPAVGKGHLIVGSQDGHVYSFNPAGGALRWNTALDSRVDSSPIIANGVVFLNSLTSVYALDLSTGAPLWQATVGQHLEYASPAVADGMVFVGVLAGLYAFSVDGVAPTKALPGGELGIKPAVSSLKPDRSLKASAASSG
jgi:outer membrane protein assembly factor BamB